MTTPPGWYPDPAHTGGGPAPERWWDGTTWTDYTRQAQGAQDTMARSPFPGYGPPEAGPSRRAKVVAGVAAVAVLAAATVGGVILFRGHGGSDDSSGARGFGHASHRPSPHDGQGGGGSSAGPSSPPSGDPNAAQDPVDGITLPVPDGWKADSGSSSEGASITTGDTYPCPGDTSSSCVSGGAYSMAASGYRAKSAKGIAKEDVPQAAQDSYGKDPDSKKEVYGGIVSHRQLKSAAVTVAGQKGYLVRWRVKTKKGAGGYVQSVAFPSPMLPELMVVVRLSFDADHKAPPVGDMDKIVQGITVLGGSGNGNSKSV